MISFRMLTVAVLANCVCLVSFAQTVPQQYSIHRSNILKKDSIHHLVNPGMKKAHRPETELDTTRIIVRLKTSPRHETTTGRLRAQEIIAGEHLDFRSLLKETEARVSSVSGGIHHAKILFEYQRSINGFALITTRAVAESIRQQKSVSSVTEDKIVRTFDEASNDVIKAPQSWQSYGITGKNIRIGIIDTGVDYNHPDLGGGFGGSYKVVGGYDFFNEDNDPMDDHGHGTHVAGIVAANGSIRGVAPDAQIFAYKVLGAGGYGYDSQILAAIERSIDPDQNPETDDALDVVNMSLGRPADPDEPLSEAVNNAVARGIIVVVAAGNDARNFSIGTPAIAQNAITTAATDNYFNTAYFSSKGPVENSFALKPDVAAPGVDIRSAFVGGAYRAESGTSMASPHVTGAVALLLERFPDASPETIKSLLMNTATSSYHYPIWDQGSGVIDIQKAAAQEFVLSPGSISMGILDKVNPVSAKSYTLTVKNLGHAPKNYSVSVSGSIVDPAITITVTPSDFTLSANETQTIQFTADINTSQLEARSVLEPYEGSIQVTDGTTTAKSIVALVNPIVTTVNFTGELPVNFFVIGLEGSNVWNAYSATKESYDLYLPGGKYDLITYYQDNHIVIEEGFSTESDLVITQDKSNASNKVEFNPQDETGNLLGDDGFLGGVCFTGKDRNFMTSYFSAVKTFHISDNDHYQFVFKYVGRKPDTDHKFRDITMSTAVGIHENLSLTNDKASFRPIRFHNPSVDEGAAQDLTFYSSIGMPWIYSTSWNTVPVTISNPVEILFSRNEIAPDLNVTSGSAIEMLPTQLNSGYSWGTTHFKLEDENSYTLSLGLLQKYGTIKSDIADYYLGQSLLFYSGSLNNTNNIYHLNYPGGALFRHSMGDRQNGTVKYTLTADGVIEKDGLINNGTVDLTEFMLWEVPLKRYKLIFEYEDYQVRGKFGKAKATLDFDLTAQDQNAPSIASLNLLVNGEPSDRLEAGNDATIKFRVRDLCSDYGWCFTTGLAEVSLEIKQIASDSWQTLIIDGSLEVGDYTAPLPDALESGYYGIKLSAKDHAGNSLVFESSPAFLVGPQTEFTPYSKVNLIAPKNYAMYASTNPEFLWSTIDDATYTFQISDSNNMSTLLTEITTTSNRLKLPFDLQKDQTYYWRVKGTSAGVITPWSNVYRFEASVFDLPRPVAPANQATDVSLPIEFTWEPGTPADFYAIQISTDPDFAFYDEHPAISGFPTQVQYLYGNTRYYWRVMALRWFGAGPLVFHSEPFQFSTAYTGGPQDPTTGVEIGHEIPDWSNHPNPFDGETKFTGSSEFTGEGEVIILDRVGAEVSRIRHYFTFGKNEIRWDGRNMHGVSLASGIYVAQVPLGNGRWKSVRIVVR